MAKAKAKSTKNAAKPAAADKAANGKAEARVVQDLARRDCKLPRAITFRTQDHGDEPVQASDIRVGDIELSEEEVCELAQEKYLLRGLFVAGGRGKPDRPLLKRFAPLKLADKIEAARVSLYLGPNAGGELKLGVCKLKSVEIVLDEGRKIRMSCLVQCTPAIDKRLGDLISRMDGGAQIAISYEHNAEQADMIGDGKPTPDENAKFEADARAQVDAFKRGTPVGDAGDSAETH
jgi:hypothetical protein